MKFRILKRHDETVRTLFRFWEMFLFPEREIALTNGCHLPETHENYIKEGKEGSDD